MILYPALLRELIPLETQSIPVVDRVVNSNRFLKIIYCYHFQKDNHPVDETALLHMKESIILM